MKQAIGAVAVLLFVLFVPVLVFSSSVLALVFDPAFYSAGQVRQQVDQTYSLPQRTLAPVNHGIVRYFQGEHATLAESFRAAGADPGFYSERETIHMANVRGLIQLIQLVQRAGLAYAIIFVVGSVALLGTKAVGRTGVCLVIGALLGVIILGLAGVATATDFEGLFLRFHLLSFANDFWMLDPRTDHLIQMFPFGFWFDAMVALVLRSLLTLAGVLLFGGFFVWLGRRLL